MPRPLGPVIVARVPGRAISTYGLDEDRSQCAIRADRTVRCHGLLDTDGPIAGL